ncbi:MAG: iron uptake porin [Nostoc sp. EkiNYC01]|nr:iron uptake porin [Nostoc sp. EkiNYC01]
MNLWHYLPKFYLVGSLSLLCLIAVDNYNLVVAEISEKTALESFLATDIELQKEISPTALKAGNALEKVQQRELFLREKAALCKFKDVGTFCSEDRANELDLHTRKLLGSRQRGIAGGDSIHISKEAISAPFDFPTTSVQAREDIPRQLTPILQGQVTSVSQLKDVQPSDWAFDALQSLIERYGVIAGYLDNTFRGNKAMTRYEFAAALNACLERVNELVAQGTMSSVSQDDLVILQRLQVEFAGELDTLRGRIDKLETHTSFLEANQFSTTTKLTGLVVLALTGGGFSGDRIIDVTGREITTENPNATLLYRATLDLTTSFSGTDLLTIWMEIGSNGPDDNAAGFLEPSFGSVLDYSAKPPVEQFGLSRLHYTFSPLKDVKLSFGPLIALTDYVDSNSYANVSFSDFSTQALINNYILLPVQGLGAGAAVTWKPGNGAFTARAAYVASTANEPNSSNSSFVPGIFPLGYILYPNARSDRGLFQDPYQGVVELEYAPSNAFKLRLQYTGGSILNGRFDALGANLELTLSERIAVFGRYGYGNYKNTAFGDINPSYWMAGIAFPDLFIPGAKSGIAVGQPFIANQLGNATQTNIEAFYNFPVSDSIRITPVVQAIVNPANQQDNGTIITGTLRTVFSF